MTMIRHYLRNRATTKILATIQRESRCCSLSTKASLATSSRKEGGSDDDSNNSEPSSSSASSSPQEQQPFVQARIQAGEWDLERTDPLYRPKWKSRAQIVSAEDFANRPTVGFTGEFENFQDAMVTLSWLDDKEQKQIYQLYLELQNHALQRHKKTSHEYVCKVIGQKFNITPQRVASTVQLQHNEQQYIKNDPDRKLLTEASEYMDSAIKQEINDAYKTFQLKKPDEFVEDPVGVLGYKEHGYQVVEDVFDVDQLLEDALVREEREARLIIDGHVYVEDIDDEDVTINMSKDAKDLLKAQKKLANSEEESTSSSPAPEIPYPKTNGEGKSRPRWKYVAQTVNTRELKKSRSKHRSYTNNNPVNTLVEEDGQLREATMADVKLTSWKPTRNVLEHTYGEAKRGWLDKTVRGDQMAWGKATQQQVQQQKRRAAEKQQGDAAGEGGDESKDDESLKVTDDGGSSSDSEGESSESSSDEEDGDSSSDEEETKRDAEEEEEISEDDDNDNKTKK